ncbi:TIGR02594 family protein [Caulobacter sp. Root343]|uniref:TIGR02594 family protein n=1 Tax=Caulobacter sp. Root343 TaxID=1736520 RepID=UPI0006FB69A1|nr:TIGR02594 family protein [Caulobacter sp. Root343]KQV66653.1 hypothetical protein ASC70_12530 [Caulobacter sp. Root343]
MAEAPWLAVARALIGTRETPGPANNPKIMDWANKLGGKKLGVAYAGDAVPWCGLFAAHCVNAVGLALPPIAVRASAWSSWGLRVTPCVGAILVFTREGGGHVGFYVGEDETHFLVLGGNQGDQVSIVKIAKDRLSACRWPGGVPLTGKPFRVTASGAAISGNEA